MSEPGEKFNLVFRGELVKGADLAQTKSNIGKLFKIQPEKVEAMFSGKPITLKRQLDLAAATKYRVAIKKAGARVDLEPCSEAVPSPVKREAEKTLSSRPADTQVASTNTPSSSSPPSPQETTLNEPGFSLAPTGSDLLTDAEKTHHKTVDLDLSGLSVRENTGNLLDTSEYKTVAPVEVDIHGLDLAEVGEDLLKPDERKETPKVKVNIDSLSLAEPGARIGPEPLAPPPAPDVSQIKLANNM